MDQIINAIVVLGKVFHPDGSPDSILRDRVDESIKQFKLHLNSLLIFSGARPHYKSNFDSPSEAEVMFEYAKNKLSALELKNVLIEDRGNSTINQLALIKEQILIPKNFKNVILVTDEVHMKRASLIFRHLLGDGYNVIEKPSKLDIAGSWRDLIQEREDNGYKMTLETRVNKIPKGDHKKWMELDNQFKNEFKKQMEKGSSSMDTIRILIDEKAKKRYNPA